MWGHKKTVCDSDAFVTLMRVAQEDADVRKTLAGILGQPSFHRQSLLNGLVTEMKLKGAPADFISAVSALLDDAVADRAREMIRGGEGVVR